MNLQNNFTKQAEDLQEVLNNRDKKIQGKLPEELEEIAKQTGSVNRKRGIKTAGDLLKMLFLYACCNISFRIPALASSVLGIAEISDTAWKKRFQKAVPFLQEILHRKLKHLIACENTSVQMTVKLVDGSIVRQSGALQSQQRIHMCYNLNENTMEQIRVTDLHTAESLSVFCMHKGDLILADAGYGKAANYLEARRQGADVILRITPSHISVYDADGNKLSILDRIKEAKNNGEDIIEMWGFCKYQGEEEFVRVIAKKLSKEQEDKARKRKLRRAQKNQQQIKEDTLFCAGYLILITSLGAEYSPEEIFHLYQSRWQVELLFKRFKQNFSVTLIKAGSASYAEAMVLLWLIIWTIAEQQAFLGDCFLYQKNTQEFIFSVYEKCKLTFLQIREILCLSRTLFLDLSDPKYLRFIRQAKRTRINQNFEFHSSILPALFL